MSIPVVEPLARSELPPPPARKPWRRAGALAGLCVAALFAACSSTPKPVQINGSVSASMTVNPSVSQRPSPLLVRLYELKTATAFNSADFVSLYQRDQAELGADLVSREEIMLNPGETRPLVKTLAIETRFFAVLGAFRDLEHAKWRSVIAVQPGQKLKLQIRADELAITATVAK